MEFHLKEFEIVLNVTRIANLHYFEFTTQYQTIKDKHNFYEILYADKGSITVESENYSGNLCDNQLIIHRPNEIHSLTCNRDGAPNVIIIGFEAQCSELEAFSHTPTLLTPANQKMLAEIMQEGMSVFAPPYDTPNLLDMKKRESCPFGAEQMLKLRLEMFLIALIRNNKNHTVSSQDLSGQSGQKLDDIYRYIGEHCNQKITLDNICFLFGTNKTSLCRNFKQEYGTTIFNHINKLKIKEAKRLLRENELSITEISENLGFSSIHYFSRIFKKIEHQSPSVYIKTIRSKLNL